MGDTAKGCLAILCFFALLILPVLALAIGWIGWDFRTGAEAGGITAAACFLLIGGLLLSIRRPSWLAVALPFLMGLGYNILPDFMPGPLGDTVVLTGGSLLTFWLWLRRQPGGTWRILGPLLLAGLYPLLGTLIPGPLDELIVAALGAMVAARQAWRPGKVAHGPD